MRRGKKDFLPPAEGQAAVEFALTILFVIIVIFWAIELIMMIYTYVVLAEAAKEGVRYAIVHGSNNSAPSGPTCPCPAIDGPAGTGVVKTTAKWSLHDTSTMTVTVNYFDNSGNPATNVDPPTLVRVVVSYPYRSFLSFGWTNLTVRAAASGRIVN
jgi:Flp pilus assembly protein TadG